MFSVCNIREYVYDLFTKYAIIEFPVPLILATWLHYFCVAENFD